MLKIGTSKSGIPIHDKSSPAKKKSASSKKNSNLLGADSGEKKSGFDAVKRHSTLGPSSYSPGLALGKSIGGGKRNSVSKGNDGTS